MIPLANVGLYGVVRTGFGLVFAVRDWQESGSRARLVGQVTADVCHALFFLGVASPPLRSAVGSWWLVLYGYALVWEAVRAYAWYESTVDSPAADNDTAAQTLIAPVDWLWALMGVAPAIAAGFYLVYLTNGGPA